MTTRSKSKYVDHIILNEKHVDKFNIDAIYQGSQFHESEEECLKFLKQWFDDKEYVILKTSGSTGKSKSISYLKKSMEASAISTGKYFNLKAQQKALVCLPVSFIAGKMMIVRSLCLGLKLYSQQPSSCPIIDQTYDFVAMTPHQVQKILEKDSNQLELIDHLIIGGGQLNNQLDKALNQLKHVHCYETFGMTETVTHIAIRKINGKNKDDSFNALAGVHFNVDKMNRLIISAHHLNIQSLQTNDIVQLINPKQFIWKGRFDNVINSGGLKIHPEWIEKKIGPLIQHPFFIAGIKDELLGEKICLFIENSNINNPINTDDLQIKLQQFLPKLHSPKKIIVISSFDYTNSGKIKRQKTLSKHGY